MGKVPSRAKSQYSRVPLHQLRVVIHKKYRPDGSLNIIAKILHSELNCQLGYKVNSYDEIIELLKGKMTVGIIAVNVSPHEVYVDIFAPRCPFTRGALQKIFKHLFRLRCRITAIVSSENMKCRKFMERLGFYQEGIKRKAFDGIADEIHFGMLPGECKWL